MLLKDSERQALEAANVALSRAVLRAFQDDAVSAQDFALLATANLKLYEALTTLGVEVVRDAAA